MSARFSSPASPGDVVLDDGVAEVHGRTNQMMPPMAKPIP
jgi:hypothetical protein